MLSAPGPLLPLRSSRLQAPAQGPAPPAEFTHTAARSSRLPRERHLQDAPPPKKKLPRHCMPQPATATQYTVRHPPAGAAPLDLPWPAPVRCSTAPLTARRSVARPPPLPSWHAQPPPVHAAATACGTWRRVPGISCTLRREILHSPTVDDRRHTAKGCEQRPAGNMQQCGKQFSTLVDAIAYAGGG